MMKLRLSKTDYLRYLQCKKYPWLCKHRKDLLEENSVEQGIIFEQGYEVEKLTHQLFKKGVEAKGDFPKLGEITKQLIANGEKVIYQATALPKGLTVKADIFILNSKTKKWDIYEVKSSTDVKDEHIFDLAFQRIAFERAGYQIGETSLIYINRDYIRKGKIKVKNLFKIEDLTTQVNNILNIVETDIPKALKLLEVKAEPEVKILKQCKKPYECGFTSYCQRGFPDHSIYDIKRINEKKLDQLLSLGISDVKDVPDDFPLSEKQRNQVEAEKTKKPNINQREINAVLNELEYPLHFLDYESFAPAVPAYDGIKPYQQVCFQFSLHVLEKPDGGLRHHEFLSTETENPIPNLLEAMRENIANRGRVIVWNKSFEMSRNKEMAELLPEYAAFLESVNRRVFDLMEIFGKQLYIHPTFKGSISIKNVLPVVVPKLSYQELEIQSGGSASLNWFQMVFGEMPKREKEEMCRNLLKYCELDTLAMVKIMEKIKS